MADNPLCLPKKRILSSLVPAFSLLGLLAFIVIGSFRLEKDFPLKKRTFFYVPPAGCLEAVSGSWKSLGAGLFYIRGILSLSDDIEDRRAWADWVEANFETATSLDPRLTQGYFFAGVVIAHTPPDLKKGIRFLEKGLSRSPREWRIPYWIGFDYYQLGDYLRAAEYYQQASRLPEAPDFLKSNPVMFYYQAGRPHEGIAYLEGLASSINDPQQLEWIKPKLKWLSDIAGLEEQLNRFRSLYGRCPQRLEELEEKGFINGIPEDPFGKGYYIDPTACRIKSAFYAPAGAEGAGQSFATPESECSRCQKK